jgi:hypothetical protein
VLDRAVASHRIDSRHLRDADFDAFFSARSDALLRLIGEAIGKAPVRVSEVARADMPDDFEPETEELEEDAVSVVSG